MLHLGQFIDVMLKFEKLQGKGLLKIEAKILIRRLGKNEKYY